MFIIIIMYMFINMIWIDKFLESDRMKKQLFIYDDLETTNKSELARKVGVPYTTLVGWIKRDSPKLAELGIEVMELREWNDLWFDEHGGVYKKNLSPYNLVGKHDNLIRFRRKGHNTHIGVANIVVHLFVEERFDPFNEKHRITWLNDDMSDCSVDNLNMMISTRKLIYGEEEVDEKCI